MIVHRNYNWEKLLPSIKYYGGIDYRQWSLFDYENEFIKYIDDAECDYNNNTNASLVLDSDITQDVSSILNFTYSNSIANGVMYIWITNTTVFNDSVRLKFPINGDVPYAYSSPVLITSCHVNLVIT